MSPPTYFRDRLAGKLVDGGERRSVAWVKQRVPAKGAFELNRGTQAFSFCAQHGKVWRKIETGDAMAEGLASTGQWNLTSPNDRFLVDWKSEEDFFIEILAVPLVTVQQSLAELGFDTDRLQYDNRIEFPDQFCGQYLDSLFRQVNRVAPNSNLFFDTVAQELVRMLLANHIKLAGAERSKHLLRNGRLTSKQLASALECLHDRIDVNLSLQEVAKAAGLSPYHFSRQFKRSTGKTLNQYQREIRVEKATALIREAVAGISEASLTQIALQCGFFDQSHMNRAFRQVSNVTPGELLRNRRDE